MPVLTTEEKLGYDELKVPMEPINEALTALLDGGHSSADISDGLTKAISQPLNTKEPMGFDLSSTANHGILELCPSASGGMYWRIDEDGNFNTFTGQTTFGDGITPLGDKVLAHRPGGTGLIEFWYLGDKVTKNAIQTIQLQDVPTKQIVAYQDIGGGVVTLAVAGSVYDAIVGSTLVAVVTGNPTVQQKVVFANERHGKEMSSATHRMLHETSGTRYGYGLDITGIVDNGATFTSIGAGAVWDEDIRHQVDAATSAPFAFRDSAGYWQLEKDALGATVSNNSLSFTNGTSADALYNLDNGDGTWSLVDTGTSYVAMHVFATNDSEHPVFKIVGQDIYDSRTEARQKVTGAASLLKEGDLPSPEFLHLYSYILDGDGVIETGADGEIYIDYRQSYPIARY